eukprot:TRINITY_DN3823_c0_g1_i1.p1 TRINITY_DN3823_c0_g1~~TRINITY_DN3823_c0_g1_i1.p1  ORF type:complete len:470 (-),score=124.12 TRINITY_DN3823_c0_g1_i1:52-1416(-)
MKRHFDHEDEWAILGLKKMKTKGTPDDDSDVASMDEESEPEIEAKHDIQWNDRFERLKEFKEKHGHLYVPRKTEKQLNRWCITQRAYRREEKLSSDRIEKLDSIGFEWGRSDSRQTEWDKQFERIKSFIKKNGHCSVPQNKDKKLNKWVEKQRASKKNNNMRKDREDRLNDIGFEWQGKNYARAWQDNYQELVAFHKKHGHIRVTSPELAKWLKYQTDRHKKGFLNDEKTHLLELLGVQWKVHSKWDDNFNLLKAYVQQNGQAPTRNEPLGYWLKEQRGKHRMHTLSNDQYQKLESLGIVWQSNWDSFFAQLQRSAADETDILNDNEPLHLWMGKQRKAKHDGTLKREKIKMLDSIQFDWEMPKDSWNEQFSLLEKSILAQSDSVFPMIEKNLYFWMRKQFLERDQLEEAQLLKLAKLNAWKDLCQAEANNQGPCELISTCPPPFCELSYQRMV